jgi:ABC-type dipeptide/oligopeptide/nickel transport system ATPase subunit
MMFVFWCFGLSTGPILNGLSVTIPQGKTVAFVGSSGSGKSSECHVIRFPPRNVACHFFHEESHIFFFFV